MEALTIDERVFDWVGMFGVALYLGSYAALQTGFLRGQGYLYPAINMAAAGCVLISLANSFNLSSAIIQISWIGISIVGIARMYYVQSRLTFTDNELLFMGDVLSGLPRERARRLLDTGLWMNASPGTVLTLQGRPVDDLIYIASGEAAVTINGKTIATVGHGAVIGEVTYRTAHPATATVTVSTDTVLLRFEAAALRAFVSRNADIGSILEQNLANHLRAKLTSMTANRAAAAE
jgi:CRP-like cAMP-binding protein